jgi:hypothetical protein
LEAISNISGIFRLGFDNVTVAMATWRRYKTAYFSHNCLYLKNKSGDLSFLFHISIEDAGSPATIEKI